MRRGAGCTHPLSFSASASLPAGLPGQLCPDPRVVELPTDWRHASQNQSVHRGDASLQSWMRPDHRQKQNGMTMEKDPVSNPGVTTGSELV